MSGITPGRWMYEEGDPGHGGSWEEPPDPGYPPYVYVEIEREGDPEVGTAVYPQTITVARLEYPAIEYVPNPENEFDPGVSPHGDAEANARLISAVPELFAAAKRAESYIAKAIDLDHLEEDPRSGLLDDLRRAIAKAEGQS